MIDPARFREFVEDHPKELAIAGLAVLLAIAASVVVLGRGSSAKSVDSARRVAGDSARALDPDELVYPREPLVFPGVQRNREPQSSWGAEESGKWYTHPDEQTLGTIRAAGRKRVDELLESVP